MFDSNYCLKSSFLHFEFVYLDGIPFRIVNGSHNFVISHLKMFYSSELFNAHIVLIIDNLLSKYYLYEVFDNNLRLIHPRCLDKIKTDFSNPFFDFCIE